MTSDSGAGADASFILPLELLLHVFSFLSPKHQANIALVSSAFRSIVNPLLYHHVTLTPPTAGPALDLFARESAFASYVTELKLHRNSKASKEPLLSRKALLNMTSLRSLVLKGPVFRHVDEQDELGDVMAELPALESFKYTTDSCNRVADTYVGPGNWFPSTKDFAQEVRLKHIHYKAEREASSFASPFWDLLSASRDTLVSLILPFDTVDETSCSPLWGMKFPHLRYLRLGIWGHELLNTNLGTTEFLLSHGDTLEQLELASGPVFAWHIAPSQNLNPNSLPNLTSYRGNCFNVMFLARAGVRSLKTNLTKLALCPGGSFNTPSPTVTTSEVWTDLFDSLMLNDLAGHSTVLKELQLDVLSGDWADPKFAERINQEEILMVIDRAAVCWGESLEVWHDGVPRHIVFKPSELADAFAQFSKLRELHMHHTNLAILAEMDQREFLDGVAAFFYVLISRCSALTDFVVHRSGDDVLHLVKLVDGRIMIKSTYSNEPIEVIEG